MATLRSWRVMAVAAGLAACAAPPAAVPPMVAQVRLVAARDVNGAAPVVVRVYQLGSTAGFERAEFFRLLNADAATLGADMVGKDEYLMAPGSTKEATINAPDRVQALGVFAAYRDTSKAWRVVVPLPAHKTTPVSLTLGAGGVSVGP